MYTGLLHLHNTMRWVILLLLLINLIRHIILANKNFTSTDKKLSLFLLISAHITLLIGLYQWFAGPWGLQTIQNMGMANVMKNSLARFWAIEHITGMLISIVLITIAHSMSKKNYPHATKHKRMALLYFFALLIIVAVVPWPFREAIARPLFPGMH